MAHRLSPEAEADLDDMWYYLATHGGSIDIADRLVDSVTTRFALLASYPSAGRRRDHDLRQGVRTFSVGEYVIAYRIDGDDVLIQRVVRGSRDIEALLRD